MRGADGTTGALFSYVDLEARVPARHPLRVIRTVVNEVLAGLDAEFARMYAALGRPSIAPEKLLRGSLLQAFYTIRSERQLMEREPGILRVHAGHLGNTEHPTSEGHDDLVIAQPRGNPR